MVQQPYNSTRFLEALPGQFDTHLTFSIFCVYFFYRDLVTDTVNLSIDLLKDDYEKKMQEIAENAAEKAALKVAASMNKEVN